jgi:hypothetical protein
MQGGRLKADQWYEKLVSFYTDGWKGMEKESRIAVEYHGLSSVTTN